jgi:hypothetical protein
MKDVNVFTVNDVRKIENRLKINKPAEHSKLTSTSRTFVRDTRFTAKEINKAFNVAKKSLETS